MKKECTAWQLRLSNTLCYRLKQILMESFFNVLLWYIQRKNIVSFTSNQITQMASSQSPRRKLLLRKYFPKLYRSLHKECPYHNHHEFYDKRCLCWMGICSTPYKGKDYIYTQSHEWDKCGIYNFQTKKFYEVKW